MKKSRAFFRETQGLLSLSLLQPTCITRFLDIRILSAAGNRHADSVRGQQSSPRWSFTVVPFEENEKPSIVQ